MYKIGELAKLSGLPIETLRFYEREALLPKAQRLPNGYRVYSEQDYQRLGFIKRSKQAGLSIREIKQILHFRDNPEQATCHDVKQVVDQQLNLVRQQIIELQRFEKSLSQLDQACCGGDDSAIHCSILRVLEDANLKHD